MGVFIQPMHKTFALLCSLLASASAVQYRAAVAVLPAQQSSRRTLDRFQTLALDAVKQGAQLVVFPEAALWGDSTRQIALADANAVAPVGSIPCDDGSTAADMPQVQRLSCIAKEAAIIVVANVLSKIRCSGQPGCPKDGYFVYNTDVVHDETGAVLANYFKRHDYRPLDQPPLLPVAFNASFGVEFGVFICYDMAFTSPADQLVARGVRNFVFSTHWLNEAPLQTATASQQGWSRWYGSNLLASNIADSVRHAGSGIYSAGEPTAGLRCQARESGPWTLDERL